MSYQETLEAAGATILEYEEFGDYQGTWYAVVNHDGDIYLTSGSYGSCSGCDALQGDIGYDLDSDSDEYKERMKLFGEGYLGDPHDIDKEIADSEETSKWDLDSIKVVEFLKRIKDQYKLEGNNAN